MKAYCAGPDTNGLIVAICLAFNREEAHFFFAVQNVAFGGKPTWYRGADSVVPDP
jgi:hypothetical protein